DNEANKANAAGTVKASAGMSTDSAYRRAPSNIPLQGTVWDNYRLRGTMTRPVDDGGHAVLLANSRLEAGVAHSASCVTCHSRASIGVIDGKVSRLTVLDSGAEPLEGDSTRGYVGPSDDAWFFARGAGNQAR